MAYPFLQVNPCCTDVVTNNPCGCSSTITNGGCNNNPCNTHLTASSTILYDGPVLPCIVAEPCDTLNVILQKIDEIICNLQTQINYLTNQVSNITNQVIAINGDIINIYNTLGECCSATTTTTTTIEPTTTTTTTTVEPTTTTTTTIEPTTTTTTTEFTPFLNSGISGIQANPVTGDCDALNYPYTPAIFPFPPSLIALRVTNLSVTWSDIEYLEIVNVTDNPNMVITYDGVAVAPTMQFVPATSSSWQYPLSLTVNTFSCTNSLEVWEIRVKLTGYPVSNVALANITFLTDPFCPDCTTTTTTTIAPTTTTTTTFPPLLLCVTYEASGGLGFINWTDCDGNPATYEYAGGPAYTFCALEDTVTADPGITITLISSSCGEITTTTTTTVGECIEFFADGGVGGGTVNYNDCLGNPQSFIVAPEEISNTYCGILGSISAGGTTISIIGPCGV